MGVTISTGSTGILGFFGLLPSSVFAIFRPRTGAYLVAIGGACLLANITLSFLGPGADVSIPPLALILGSLLLASPIAVAALLFYASRPHHDRADGQPSRAE